MSSVRYVDLSDRLNDKVDEASELNEELSSLRSQLLDLRSQRLHSSAGGTALRVGGLPPECRVVAQCLMRATADVGSVAALLLLRAADR